MEAGEVARARGHWCPRVPRADGAVALAYIGKFWSGSTTVRRRCALNAAIADAARDVAGRVRGVIGALGVEERYT